MVVVPIAAAEAVAPILVAAEFVRVAVPEAVTADSIVVETIAAAPIPVEIDSLTVAIAEVAAPTAAVVPIPAAASVETGSLAVAVAEATGAVAVEIVDSIPVVASAEIATAVVAPIVEPEVETRPREMNFAEHPSVQIAAEVARTGSRLSPIPEVVVHSAPPERYEQHALCDHY